MPLRVASAMSLRNSSPDFGANNSANTAPIPAPTKKYVKRVEILSPESRSFPITSPFFLGGGSPVEDRQYVQIVRMMTARDYNKSGQTKARNCLMRTCRNCSASVKKV